jgi:hypothetical protein
MTAPAPRRRAASGGFDVRELRPQDAHLVPELVGRVDSSFAHPGLHDEAAVAAMVRDASRLLFVGLDAAGNARGMIGIAFSAPTRAVAELGVVVTDPTLAIETRGRLLHALMGAAMARVRRLVREEGLRTLMSSEVTTHRLSQRLAELAGFVTTGLLIAAPRADGVAAPGRLAGATQTFSVRCFVEGTAPYAVAVPPRFDGLLRALYGALGLPVSVVAPTPARGATVLSEGDDGRRHLSVLELTAVGEDAPAVLRRWLASRHGANAALHVRLPLGEHDLAPAVEELCGAGLRYAALIPGWRGSDALVLQSVDKTAPGLDERALHAPLARRILREILSGSPPRDATPAIAATEAS